MWYMLTSRDVCFSLGIINDYVNKITFLPILQNVGQNVVMLDVVEVCICDPFHFGNTLIFSDLVTGV